jgi:hypothetical protein
MSWILSILIDWVYLIFLGPRKVPAPRNRPCNRICVNVGAQPEEMGPQTPAHGRGGSEFILGSGNPVERQSKEAPRPVFHDIRALANVWIQLGLALSNPVQDIDKRVLVRHASVMGVPRDPLSVPEPQERTPPISMAARGPAARSQASPLALQGRNTSSPEETRVALSESFGVQSIGQSAWPVADGGSPDVPEVAAMPVSLCENMAPAGGAEVAEAAVPEAEYMEWTSVELLELPLPVALEGEPVDEPMDWEFASPVHQGIAPVFPQRPLEDTASMTRLDTQDSQPTGGSLSANLVFPQQTTSVTVGPFSNLLLPRQSEAVFPTTVWASAPQPSPPSVGPIHHQVSSEGDPSPAALETQWSRPPSNPVGFGAFAGLVIPRTSDSAFPSGAEPSSNQSVAPRDAVPAESPPAYKAGGGKMRRGG